VHERERGRVVVHDHRNAWVLQKVPTLDGPCAGGQHQLLAVEHEPDRHHVRGAFAADRGELPSPRPMREELADLGRCHLARRDVVIQAG
jgi:hypothetical protein